MYQIHVRKVEPLSSSPAVSGGERSLRGHHSAIGASSLYYLKDARQVTHASSRFYCPHLESGPSLRSYLRGSKGLCPSRGAKWHVIDVSAIPYLQACLCPHHPKIGLAPFSSGAHPEPVLCNWLSRDVCSLPADNTAILSYFK